MDLRRVAQKSAAPLADATSRTYNRAMSAIELISEKSRSLTEAQALSVLAFIEALGQPQSPSASELMKLPLEVRQRVLAAQMVAAEKIYRENPELIWDDAEAPMDYAESNAR